MKHIVHATLLAMSLGLAAGNPSAADYRLNPFKLGWEGAITRNLPSELNVHSVSYPLNGIEIAANFCTPANFDASLKCPTSVVAHSNGGVKERVAGLYAQRLGEQGYIAITADTVYQGASGGQSRSVDMPSHRIKDIHGMADFISQFPWVDTTLVGLLGICGGGGYSLAATQTDKRCNGYADSIAPCPWWIGQRPVGLSILPSRTAFH